MNRLGGKAGIVCIMGVIVWVIRDFRMVGFAVAVVSLFIVVAEGVERVGLAVLREIRTPVAMKRAFIGVA